MPSPGEPAAASFRPKAIVFDLLTALLDSWTLWDASTPTGTAVEGRRWRERYLELTYGQGAYVPYPSLVAQSAADVGLPPSSPETLLAKWTGLQAWPETGEVLRRLREKGYLLGVVTNCSLEEGQVAVRRAEQAAVAAAATKEGEGGGEVADWKFDTSITAEQAGFYKPRLEAYHAILPLLGKGLKADEVLFVAGSNGDVQGANEAGFKVVWHNKIGLPKKGDREPLREATTLDGALKDFM